MTTDSSFPYTAGFKLFRPDGLQVYFTVNGAEPVAHAAAVDNYIAAMMTTGYAVNPPSLEAGERIESIGAWALGETSHDQPCVYLYGSHPGLQFRIVTVYEERIPDLPFKVDTNGKRWMGAAPTRDMAAQKGYLNVVADFDIVLTPHEYKTKDDGSPVMIFGRVKAKPAAPAQSPEPQPQTNGSGNNARPADEVWATWQGVPDAVAWAMKQTGGGRAVFNHANHARNAWSELQREKRLGNAEMYPVWVDDVQRRAADLVAAAQSGDLPTPEPADLLAAVGENAASAYNMGAFDTK